MAALQINPGNVLPIYEKAIWQRHRWHGCDQYPYGIPYPNTMAMPFQFPTSESITGTVTATLYTFPERVATFAATITDKLCVSGDANYLTYPGAIMPYSTGITDGYYYWEIANATTGTIFYSDIIHHKSMPLANLPGLAVQNCSDVGAGRASFTIVAEDYIGCDTVSTTIEYLVGSTWTTLSGALVTTNATEYLRRIVVTQDGATLTAYYTLTWDLAACASNTLTLTDRDNTKGPNQYWRITATNDKDKDGVIYQNGYTQQVWFEPTFLPIEIERDETPRIDADGTENVANATTREIWRFTAPRLPDYAIFPLTIFRDLGTVKLYGHTILDEVSMTNYKFNFDLDGACLNLGEWSFDKSVEVNRGCDEDKTGATCT